MFPSTEEVAEPDVILVYLTPGQLSKLATAIAYTTGEQLKIESVGKASSCGGVVKAHLTHRLVRILPGLGDHTIAWRMDDEIP